MLIKLLCYTLEHDVKCSTQHWVELTWFCYRSGMTCLFDSFVMNQSIIPCMDFMQAKVHSCSEFTLQTEALPTNGGKCTRRIESIHTDLNVDEHGIAVMVLVI